MKVYEGNPEIRVGDQTTPIGTGIAGFEVAEMAVLFTAGVDLPNLVFPEEFANVLKGDR